MYLVLKSVEHRAMAYICLGEIPLAMNDLDRVLALEPNQPDALVLKQFIAMKGAEVGFRFREIRTESLWSDSDGSISLRLLKPLGRCLTIRPGLANLLSSFFRFLLPLVCNNIGAESLCAEQVCRVCGGG
jgi:hypothetical protein